MIRRGFELQNIACDRKPAFSTTRGDRSRISAQLLMASAISVKEIMLKVQDSRACERLERPLEQENARLRRLLSQVGLHTVPNEVADNVQKAIIGEVHHRARNLLSMVSAIAGQSIGTAKSLEDAEEKVHGRIMALARAYDVVQQENTETAPMLAVVRAAMEPLHQKQLFSVSMPDGITLSVSAAQSVCLVINELCTNAIKHGALSRHGGSVDLTGGLNDAKDRLSLVWTESGGPPVVQPASRGFGMRLIEISIRDADVQMDFRRSGLVCEMRIPVASLTSA